MRRLRPYQQEAVESVYAQWRELPRPEFVEHGDVSPQLGLMKLIESEPAGPDLRERFAALWRENAHTWTDQHSEAVKARLAGA